MLGDAAMKAIAAGAVYFAAVFALGFVLGTLRVFVLEPIIGPLAAVLIELPFILGASWFVCGMLIRRFAVPAGVYARFFMGLVAFALLITAEYVLARYGFGRTGDEQLRAMASAPGAIGLAGQILFALFPLMQIYSGGPQR
ncbi:MAG: hypothetical protein ACX939_05960 [Hyphococcus sp.]